MISKCSQNGLEFNILLPKLFKGGSNNIDHIYIRKIGLYLANKYKQDSFLYKPASSYDGYAYFIDGNNQILNSFANVVVNDSEQEYYTKLNKHKNGQFSFV